MSIAKTSYLTKILNKAQETLFWNVEGTGDRLYVSKYKVARIQKEHPNQEHRDNN